MGNIDLSLYYLSEIIWNIDALTLNIQNHVHSLLTRNPNEKISVPLYLYCLGRHHFNYVNQSYPFSLKLGLEASIKCSIMNSISPMIVIQLEMRTIPIR